MKKIILTVIALMSIHFAFSQDAYVGEIRIFTGNFAPRGWAFCNGQLLPISQNTALFSLLGATYGGDGRATFALPNLQGRVPVQAGQGLGLTYFSLGETYGSETVTLTNNNLPIHTHAVTLNQQQINETGTTDDPTGKQYAVSVTNSYATTSNAQSTTPAVTVGISGGNQPMNNMQPYLVVNYIICLQGIYPARP
jgi:microcystin-dependent protein